MHFEVDRSLNEEAAEDLVAHIERVLRDLRLAVRDFLPMVDRVERMIEVAGRGRRALSRQGDPRVGGVPAVAD